MVTFNFTLSNKEADTIIYTLRDRIHANYIKIQELTSSSNYTPDYDQYIIDNYNNDSSYIKSILEKITANLNTNRYS